MFSQYIIRKVFGIYFLFHYVKRRLVELDLSPGTGDEVTAKSCDSLELSLVRINIEKQNTIEHHEFLSIESRNVTLSGNQELNCRQRSINVASVFDCIHWNQWLKQKTNLSPHCLWVNGGRNCLYNTFYDEMTGRLAICRQDSIQRQGESCHIQCTLQKHTLIKLIVLKL